MRFVLSNETARDVGKMCLRGRDVYRYGMMLIILIYFPIRKHSIKLCIYLIGKRGRNGTERSKFVIAMLRKEHS